MQKGEEKTRKIGMCCIGVAIFIIIVICFFIYSLVEYNPDTEGVYASQSDNEVSRVIDGDTFELANGNIVRLICIDAPELGEPGAEESKEFLESLILNEEVNLISDVDDKDAYGRLLRYVYVKKLGSEIFVNKEMVSNGYATIFRYGNNTELCDKIEG